MLSLLSMETKSKPTSECLIWRCGSVIFIFVVSQNIFSIFFARAILCARSNYFSAMLYGDWIEGKTKEIPLIG